MSPETHNSVLNRRHFLVRSAKAGLSIAAACAAGFWFHDAKGPGRPTAHDSDIRLPDTVFAQIPQMLVKPVGQFDLHIRELSFNDQRLADLNAALDWSDAGIQGEEQILGNYRAEIARLQFAHRPPSIR